MLISASNLFLSDLSLKKRVFTDEYYYITSPINAKETAMSGRKNDLS